MKCPKCNEIVKETPILMDPNSFQLKKGYYCKNKHKGTINITSDNVDNDLLKKCFYCKKKKAISFIDFSKNEEIIVCLECKKH